MTRNAYIGKHGLSLRLAGMEKSNDKIMQRAVVMHPAVYATPAFAKAHGYLGHSWGCFAIDPTVSKQVINTIKDGSVIYSYYS